MMETIRRLILASGTYPLQRGSAGLTQLRSIVIKTGSSTGGKFICLCWVGDALLPGVVAKFARHQPGNARIEAEHQALVNLRQYAEVITERVPRPLGSTEAHGHVVTIETAVQGRPLRTYLHERPAGAGNLSQQEPLIEWLTTLGVISIRAAESADLQRLVFGPIEKALVESGLSEDERDALSRLYGSARELVGKSPLPVIFTHNDLGTPNVMIGKGGDFEGVIDWESGGPGLPATDLIYFLGRFAYEVRGSRDDELRGYRELFFDSATSAGVIDSTLARKWLRGYCAQLRVATAWLPILFGLCWIMHARNEEQQAASRRELLPSRQGGVADTHFREHLRFFLRNVAQFEEATGCGAVDD